MLNISAFNSLQTGVMQQTSGFGFTGAFASISASFINTGDTSRISPDIKDNASPLSLLKGFGASFNLSGFAGQNGIGINGGQGMIPGFGGALNSTGSLFGGLMQQMQNQQQMMQMMLMMLMMMTMQKQNGFACQTPNCGMPPTGAIPSSGGGMPTAPGIPSSGGGIPAAGGGMPAAAGAPSQPAGNISGQKMGQAKGTGYFPENSAMEGGYNDMKGAKLCTLQDFLSGKASYVSIALDKNLYKSGKIKYGDTFRIPEIEKKYNKQIIFKAVDTGGAFTNKGFSRVDICTGSRKDSMDPVVNGNLTLIKS